MKSVASAFSVDLPRPLRVPRDTLRLPPSLQRCCAPPLSESGKWCCDGRTEGVGGVTEVVQRCVASDSSFVERVAASPALTATPQSPMLSVTKHILHLHRRTTPLPALE